MRRARGWPAAVLLGIVVLVGGCTAGGGPILANPTAAQPSVAAPTPRPSMLPDPVPVVLPRDDGPHDRLTEWWYYTGHLRTADGA
ncbi:MAG: hypothetical protein QOJ75_225, partial [Chloroflexota bacterium]|nr:hypothetical protein [Chloroflexota bacterium]